MDSKSRPSPKNALAISVWENEGGALNRDSMHSQYGRRIEPDGTWTVYHVFTGAPASIGGQLMASLKEEAATETMLWVNASNAERRRIATRSGDDDWCRQ